MVEVEVPVQAGEVAAVAVPLPAPGWMAVDEATTVQCSSKMHPFQPLLLRGPQDGHLEL